MTPEPTRDADYVATVGSLFSGIGGIELGLERAGMTPVWNSETQRYACLVLKRHWPTVPNLGDVTLIDWSTVERPDVLCGGFPCQDISRARSNGGPRPGLRGDKSGLWTYFAAGIDALRPRWVIAENVADWQRWVPEVRSDLARLGYASMPLVLSAGSLGAPHRRPRCFVVANAHGDSESLLALHAEVEELRPISRSGSGHWWDPEPSTLRVDDGLPRRMERLGRLGNAVVPQVAEWLGRKIARIDGVDHG